MAVSDITISQKPIPNTYRFIDRTGFRYGKLTVLFYTGSAKKKTYWHCRCDCGNEVTATANNLVSGNTKGCSCMRDEHIKNLNLTHGLTKTPEHRIWTNMRNRCLNPHNRSFHDYGERGITVCDRWQHFEHFLSDMGKRPSKNHSIERINNNLGYGPDNCKWVLRATQNRNKRNTVYLTFKGKTQSLYEWSEELHITSRLVRQRLAKGWDVETALTSPLRVNQFG